MDGGGTYHILLSGVLLPMLQGESVEKSSREVRSQVVKQTFLPLSTFQPSSIISQNSLLEGSEHTGSEWLRNAM